MSGIIGGAGSKSGVIGTTELDYEEGTWTVTNSSATPQSQECIYTKVGRLVHCSGTFESHASSTSAALWGGLPFPSSSDASQGVRGAGGTAYQSNTSSTQFGVLVTVEGTEGRSGFYLESGSTSITFGTSKHAYFYITYITDS
jgi:hypothetical protein